MLGSGEIGRGRITEALEANILGLGFSQVDNGKPLRTV